MVLVDDRLAEFTNSMSAPMGRLEYMDKHIDELESTGDIDDHCGEMQVTKSSMVADFESEIQVLRALEAANDGNSKLTRPKSRLPRLRLRRTR